ncbi:hypothetical protein [Perlucidibaca aquatica]|uniref:hypothetical protein n=1 Tax=Perlucidibaca aquatica TaxID=1852776 RepID=UPI0012FD7A58|nr:hypothetical protein [Perlucidibaca aquatica]
MAMFIMLFWPPIMLLIIFAAVYFLWHYPAASEERAQAKNILMRLAVIILAFYLGLVAEKLGLGSLPLYVAYGWLIWQVLTNLVKLQRAARTVLR